MFNNVLTEALSQISEDDKFIRITAITTLIHSLIFVIIVLYNTNNLVYHFFWQGVQAEKILQYGTDLFINSGIPTIIFTTAIILTIGYFLLYPIGEATMISYLDDEHRHWKKALLRGFNYFFPLFEFHALNGIGFNILSFIFIIGRIWMMGILNSPLIIIILIMRGSIIAAMTVLWPYTKFLIVLEDLNVWDALKKSITMSFNNFSTTLKFVGIGLLLQLRFLINIIILIGAPILLVRGAVEFNIINSIYTTTIIYTTLGGIIILIAYTNAIIEAFFMTYWYKVYKIIS